MLVEVTRGRVHELREFEVGPVGWAMCINPMCEHFGAFFGPADEPGSAAPRYKLIGGRPRPAQVPRLRPVRGDPVAPGAASGGAPGRIPAGV